MPKNSVRVVADSGCDLPADLVEQYEITIIPCYVRFGQEAVSDDKLTPEQFWTRVERSPQIPASATPAPSSYQQAYQKLIAAGHDVLCLTLTSRYSGVHNVAWLAAQEFGQRVRVVDSQSLTLGMGIQVLEAARQALAGHGVEAIQKRVESLRSRTSVLFALETLEWVRRGGRLDRIMPLVDRVARTFHVRPIVEMGEGEMKLLGVSRSLRGALARMEEEVRSRLPVERLATVYTRSCQAADALTGRLSALTQLTRGEIMQQEAGPVFAVHAGPNAVGTVVVRS